MAKLYIDTSDSEKIIVGVDGENVIHDAKVEKSQKLLSVINEILNEQKIKLTDIGEIEVNIGPGSFTGLRVGIAVANTLGWTLQIPVNGKNVEKNPIEPVYE